MSINAPSSSVGSTSQVNSTSSSDSAKKSSGDSSFKDEMDKVSSTEKQKEEEKIAEKAKAEKAEKAADKEAEKEEEDKNLLEGNIEYSKYASMAMMDVNQMLSNDIRQMANTISEISSISDSKSAQNSLFMSESDAEFFIGLTQQNDISMQNITAQAQNMVNSGAEVREVKQNVQISQALLEAINNARETNQPLRIDFSQNVSVILRVGKDGVISANFIPGDKAVEQYLRNNIDSLKATFNEQDLPYSNLSYSNRGKQQQKEQRQNKR